MDKDYANEKFWKSLVGDGPRAESVLADYFTWLGYRVERTKASADGGWDLKLLRHGFATLIDSKAYSNSLGVEKLSRIHHAMVREGADKAGLVGLGGFSRQCQKEASNPRAPVQLISTTELVRWATERKEELRGAEAQRAFDEERQRLRNIEAEAQRLLDEERQRLLSAKDELAAELEKARLGTMKAEHEIATKLEQAKDQAVAELEETRQELVKAKDEATAELKQAKEIRANANENLLLAQEKADKASELQDRARARFNEASDLAHRADGKRRSAVGVVALLAAILGGVLVASYAALLEVKVRERVAALSQKLEWAMQEGDVARLAWQSEFEARAQEVGFLKATLEVERNLARQSEIDVLIEDNELLMAKLEMLNNLDPVVVEDLKVAEDRLMRTEAERDALKQELAELKGVGEAVHR